MAAYMSAGTWSMALVIARKLRWDDIRLGVAGPGAVRSPGGSRVAGSL